MKTFSPLIQQQFGESYSPFCDVDVIETAWQAPIEQRWQYKLYDLWIIRKYPDMKAWKHNGIYTIGHRPRTICLFGRNIPYNELPKRSIWYILKKLHIHDSGRETTGNTMTPEDDWMEQNKALKKWSENYIRDNIRLLNPFPEVQIMAEKFFHGNATERMQVLSLLACLRQAR